MIALLVLAAFGVTELLFRLPNPAKWVQWNHSGRGGEERG